MIVKAGVEPASIGALPIGLRAPCGYLSRIFTAKLFPSSPLSFITMGIALPRQGGVPGLTGMSSHTQSDFHCLETKKPPEGGLLFSVSGIPAFALRAALSSFRRST
ncbi:hypothetical protein DJ481_20325 [Enterobacter hormaechei]|nr:hypothetical protein [Enterobacter hormaechei]TYF15601.1 hypothetical protein DJ481_20325 [Enterobacter hormaechei]